MREGHSAGDNLWPAQLMQPGGSAPTVSKLADLDMLALVFGRSKHCCTHRARDTSCTVKLWACSESELLLVVSVALQVLGTMRFTASRVAK